MNILHEILKRLNKYIIYNIFGYPIKNFYRSIPEALCYEDVKRHIVNYLRISDPSIVKYEFPKEYPEYFRRDAIYPARHVYNLRDVYVNSMTGACGTRKIAFLESYGSLRFWLLFKPLNMRTNNDIGYVDEGTCIAPTSYYHFVIERLPRLIFVLKSYKNIPIYYYHDIPKYVYNILEYVSNIYKRQLIPTKYKILHFNNYYFTQAYDKSGFVTKSDINMIKNTFSRKVYISRDQPSKMIYISRSNSLRPLSNEYALEKHLKAIGFDMLLTEEMCFQDKIELFQNVNTVVASHGAGLTNLIWGNPGTRVIEIFSSLNNDCYARLALSLGMDYEYIMAEHNGSSGWEINIDKLLRILAK